MIGSKQQAISRLEKNEHSPSLKLFYSIVDALGYELQIVKNRKYKKYFIEKRLLHNRNDRKN